MDDSTDSTISEVSRGRLFVTVIDLNRRFLGHDFEIFVEIAGKNRE
jgi:hypothetical protein